MSGLFARAKPAGRDGVRYARSKHMGDILGASVTFGSSRVSTDRSFHLLRPASSWAIRRATLLAGRFQITSAWRLSAGCTRRPISSSAKRLGKLVGQGHGDQLWRLSLQQRSEPWCGLMTALSDMPQQRGRTDDQRRPQYRISGLCRQAFAGRQLNDPWVSAQAMPQSRDPI